MSETQDIWEEAGSLYNFALDFSFQDAGNGLRYALLRLSTQGLTKQDQEELAELGRLAIWELDVEQAANRIRERADASPLAVAIANIVRQASFFGAGGGTSTKMAMLGAVFGAYTGTAFSGGGGDPHVRSVLGAIGGAVATSTNKILQDRLEAQSWQEFLERGQHSS